MSRDSMQTNEILEMRNSMKLNFVNHLRTSKKPMPQTFQLYTQQNTDLKDPPQFTFKVKSKTLDWENVNKSSELLKSKRCRLNTPSGIIYH